MLRDEPGGKTVQSFKSSAHSLGIWFAALARRTAPGLGYGRCWKRGPDAVVSAPVFASLCFGKPLDQVPLQRRNSFVKDRKMFAEARTGKSALFKRWTLFFSITPSNKDSQDLNDQSSGKFTLGHQNKHLDPWGPSHHRSFSLREKQMSDIPTHEGLKHLTRSVWKNMLPLLFLLYGAMSSLLIFLRSLSRTSFLSLSLSLSRSLSRSLSLSLSRSLSGFSQCVSCLSSPPSARRQSQKAN